MCASLFGSVRKQYEFLNAHSLFIHQEHHHSKRHKPIAVESDVLQTNTETEEDRYSCRLDQLNGDAVPS